jgi:putative transposase
MARKPRFIAAEQAHLVSQSALDQVPLLRDEDDFINFLALLKDSAKVNEVSIHGYALLPTEVFLLATPREADGLSRFMQWVGRRYVPIYNQKYKREGSLWRARFRAAAVDGRSELIGVSQYVDESPLRAGLCLEACDYSWSSCGAHIGAQRDPLLTDHPSYWALGNTPFDREVAYKQRLEQALTAAETARIESSLRAGWAIGPASFASALELTSGRRLQPGRRGRPPRQSMSDAPMADDVSPINSANKLTGN